MIGMSHFYVQYSQYSTVTEYSTVQLQSTDIWEENTMPAGYNKGF